MVTTLGDPSEAVIVVVTTVGASCLVVLWSVAADSDLNELLIAEGRSEVEVGVVSASGGPTKLAVVRANEDAEDVEFSDSEEREIVSAAVVNDDTMLGHSTTRLRVEFELSTVADVVWEDTGET